MAGGAGMGAGFVGWDWYGARVAGRAGMGSCFGGGAVMELGLVEIFFVFGEGTYPKR